MPSVTRYRVEEVEIGPARDGDGVVNEVLGIAAAPPPEGLPRRSYRVRLEGSGFLIRDNAVGIAIGRKILTNVTLAADNSYAEGYVDALPEDGSEIAFLNPAEESGRTVIARFDRGALDNEIAVA